ncbi:MAG TPA: ankyrin repeat domain-containing protein, partial [Planococcus sp. (in: firmicutes)]|nr:ankyrin repeat domain-containing protein [Planococcus sp. (in: firmicutes)]
VLYSEVFELAREQGNDELDFILAHELAHIKRRHVWKNIIILPAALIPFLAQAYSRSCEYTCDRHAAYVVNNAAASKRALTLLGIGKKMYREVNEDAYMEQIKNESNGVVWFSEILSTHPNLPKRIQSIQQFAGQGLVGYRQNTGKIALGATLLFGSMFAVYFLSVALFAGGGQVYSQFLSDFYMDEEWGESYGIVEGETALMSAAYAGDIDGIEEALANGEDLHAVDSEGADALMYAVYSGNTEAVQFLIDAGADVETKDDYSTALATAAAIEDYRTALVLVENGADPLAYGPDGLNALDYMGAASEEEFMDQLNNR